MTDNSSRIRTFSRLSSSTKFTPIQEPRAWKLRCFCEGLEDFWKASRRRLPAFNAWERVPHSGAATQKKKPRRSLRPSSEHNWIPRILSLALAPRLLWENRNSHIGTNSSHSYLEKTRPPFRLSFVA